MNKKKIIIIALSLILFLVAGVFVSLFGKQDIQKIKDNISNSVQSETNVNQNIIQNSNFSINTTGNTLLNQDNIKNGDVFLDDWLFCSQDNHQFTSYLVPTGLYMRNDGTERFTICQDVSEGVILYGNKEVTLTISVDDIVYSVTGVLTENDSLVINVFSGENNVSNTSVLLYISTGVLSFNISFNEGANFIMNWVKLELGNVFTGYSA